MIIRLSGPFELKLNNIEIKYTFLVWMGNLKSFRFFSSGNDILSFKLLTSKANFGNISFIVWGSAHSKIKFGKDQKNVSFLFREWMSIRKAR